MRSEFGLLGCILNVDSTENCLEECSVRFIDIQHRAALGWIFGEGRAVGSDGLRVVCNRLNFQGGNREFDKTICCCDRRRNWKWLQPLTTAVVRRWWESRLILPVHNLGQCRLSWWVCARLRKAASRIVGFVQISRSWKDFAVRNGKFVLTVNSIKTSRTRAKTWLILLVKQFRSVTQPRDKRDTESRRSADNLASLQTSSHSVYQAITFTSSLTERFDCNRIWVTKRNRSYKKEQNTLRKGSRNLPIHPSIHPPTQPSTHPPIHPSIHPVSQ